ncbi:hypothetical protein ACLMJK_007782 [Lecanora helva]
MPEFSSIALVGDNYFLCSGGQGPNKASARDRSFYDALSHGPNVSHTYVAIGEAGSYFIKYRDDRGSHFSVYALSIHYPGLHKELSSSEDSPTFVSLGPAGNYFARWADGRYMWNLDSNTESHLNLEDDASRVKRMWLGKDSSYIALYENGGLAWNLKGNYGSLHQSLKYFAGDKVLGVGLNLQNGRSYIVLFSDGKVRINGTGTGLTHDSVSDWLDSAL